MSDSKKSVMKRLIDHAEERLLELLSWYDLHQLPLAEGTLQAIPEGEEHTIEIGQTWPEPKQRVRITFEAEVPAAWSGSPVNVRIDVGGEGLLSVNGKLVGGIGPFHNEYRVVDSAMPDQEIVIEVEAVPRGLFGSPIAAPRIAMAQLVVPDEQMRELYEDLNITLEAAQAIGSSRPEISELLVRAIDRATRQLPLSRSPTEPYLARLGRLPPNAPVIPGRTAATHLPRTIWEQWHWPGPMAQLSQETYARLPAIRTQFKNEIERIRQRYPTEGKLLLSGHSHLDLAWLWPMDETRRKAQRTFSSVLTLFGEYEDFRFNQSSAQLYDFVEQDAPELFQRIKEQVESGRWEIVGGMWVEPDGNLPSGEAWARQLLYGQRYFQSRFGRQAKVAWLPDTFGFSANLPQLFQQAGLPYFFTTKLNWNDSNEFPHDLYWWEALDGSRVLAHSFVSPYNYNARITASTMQETWRNFEGKRHHDRSLLTFGHGDGGGGPSKEMLERYERLRDFPGLPSLEMGSVDAFFGSVSEEDLPVWKGEQYLEFHRGSYSSQSRLKKLNRQVEQLLVSAEVAATLGFVEVNEPYPQKKLLESWTKLLRNQFHDILPGSSIRTVNERAEEELQSAHALAVEVRDDALARLTEEVDQPILDADLQLVIWNLTLEDRPLQLVTPRPVDGPFRCVMTNGQEVPHQEVENDEKKIVISAPDVKVPGLGYLSLSIVREEGLAIWSDLQVRGTNTMENDLISVEIGADGTISSILDKKKNREILADRGNQVWAYTDIPGSWEAWNIDEDYTKEGVELVASDPPELIESGPLRMTMRVVRRLGDSVIEQDYRLYTRSRRIEVSTRIAWQGRRTMLRALFPFAIDSHEAWYETAFGAVPRPTHKNTSWDRARFEVPAHRWADLSEPGYGVSLLNDCKYGHSASGNVLGLTLLRSPIYPDPYADEGQHELTYAIWPHDEDWRSGGTVSEAHDLGSPLVGVVTGSSTRNWPTERRFVDLRGTSLQLAGLKKAEDSDDVCLRLYEAHGARGRATLSTSFNVSGCESVDLLEASGKGGALAKDKEGAHELFYKPYQVLTLKLSR